MAGITKMRFDDSEEVMKFAHGRASMVNMGEEQVWLSELEPGWSWDEDLKPWAGDLKSCPLTHREYVVSGTVRYLMEDGTEETGKAGDFLFIEPGHRAWVEGEETCVLVDW